MLILQGCNFTTLAPFAIIACEVLRAEGRSGQLTKEHTFHPFAKKNQDGMGKVSMIQGLELEEVDWAVLCLVMSIQMSSLDEHFSYNKNVEQMVATR